MNIVKVDRESWMINQPDNTSWMLTFYNGVYSLRKEGKTYRYNDDTIGQLVDKRKLFSQKRSKIANEYTRYVYGYPIKNNNIDCVDDGSGRPLFKKNKVSSTVYCAGYYAVYSHGTWLTCFCPKLKTIESCKKYLGPFKNVEELENNIPKHKPK